MKHEKLFKMKIENEKSTQTKQPTKIKKCNLDDDDFFNSCDDIGDMDEVPSLMLNTKSKSKKFTFQPIDTGKIFKYISLCFSTFRLTLLHFDTDRSHDN